MRATAFSARSARLSVLSTLLIGALLLLVYRSVTLLLLGFLPVVCGALVGLAAVALTFNVVYGITLGFGITLIGEAVDYSVYLFVQSGGRTGAAMGAGNERTTSLWPVIWLGMLTSVCGFASLLPSAFPSLAQLGLYTIAGLIAAALTTRFVLPALLPAAATVDALRLPTEQVAPRHYQTGARPAAGLAAGGVGRVHAVHVPRAALEPGAQCLEPVPLAEQQRDARLRADLGAADVSDLVTVSGADADQVLAASEQVGARLDALVSNQELGGYESAARYLPSRARQQARRDSLPEAPALRAHVAAAAAEAGLNAARLEPFIADVAAARNAPLLGRRDLDGTTLATAVDSLLVPVGSGWTALLPLRSAGEGGNTRRIDTARLQRELAALSVPGVTITALNLKLEADALYNDYLHSALRLCCAGLAAIAVLLCLSLRSFVRAGKVLLPLALAALTVACGFALSHQPMNLLHLIGLLLIFAVGSNYALFFDRRARQPDRAVAARTLSSLLLANLTAIIAFGVLASSHVPVLSALGSTVAPGAFLALFFSAVLAGGDGTARPGVSHAG